MEPEDEWRFPPDGKPYKVPVRCLVGGPQENRPAALAKLEAAMIGAEKRQLQEWVAVVQVATAGGRRSEVTATLALAVYVDALSKYPADVARTACNTLQTTAEWFPPVAGFVSLCEQLVAPRRSMIAALRASL